MWNFQELLKLSRCIWTKFNCNIHTPVKFPCPNEVHISTSLKREDSNPVRVELREKSEVVFVHVQITISEPHRVTEKLSRFLGINQFEATSSAFDWWQAYRECRMRLKPHVLIKFSILLHSFTVEARAVVKRQTDLFMAAVSSKSRQNVVRKWTSRIDSWQEPDVSNDFMRWHLGKVASSKAVTNYETFQRVDSME